MNARNTMNNIHLLSKNYNRDNHLDNKFKEIHLQLEAIRKYFKP